MYLYTKNNGTKAGVKKKRVLSNDTKDKISAVVKKYHRKCRENAAKLAKLTKVTEKKNAFHNHLKLKFQFNFFSIVLVKRMKLLATSHLAIRNRVASSKRHLNSRGRTVTTTSLVAGQCCEESSSKPNP